MIMVRQAERPYTAEDLAEMPDDGRRYEVIGGELIVSPSPSERHQSVLSEIWFHLRVFISERNLGKIYPAPFDVFFDEHDIMQPDLVVVLKQNRSRIQRHGVVGAPDLVVEIISPGSQGTDRVRKSAAYATFGVPEYWLVDPPTETILVQVLRDGRYHPIVSADGLVRLKVLDGLIIDPREIFAIPDWMAEAIE